MSRRAKTGENKKEKEGRGSKRAKGSMKTHKGQAGLCPVTGLWAPGRSGPCGQVGEKPTGFQYPQSVDPSCELPGHWPPTPPPRTGELFRTAFCQPCTRRQSLFVIRTGVFGVTQGELSRAHLKLPTPPPFLRIKKFSLVQFSHSVMSDSLPPHGLQHARLPCPSPTPGAYSNSHPLSQWSHPTRSLRNWF